MFFPTPIEQAVGRIFHEESANVRQIFFLKDVNVQVAVDTRRLEVHPQDFLVVEGLRVGDRCHSSRGC